MVAFAPPSAFQKNKYIRYKNIGQFHSRLTYNQFLLKIQQVIYPEIKNGLKSILESRISKNVENKEKYYFLLIFYYYLQKKTISDKIIKN